MVYVREGTINAKGTWKLTTTGAITLGTTPLTFENEVMAHLAENVAKFALVDADILAIETDIATLDTEKADKTEVNTLATAKADKIYVDTLAASIASGSPKAVYATVAALTTAIPAGNTNIYLVIADGKWYYWNGAAWIAGGTYQSTGIPDKSITPQKTSFFEPMNLFDTSDFVDNKFISSNTETTSAAYFHSGFIPVEYDKYYVISTNAASLGCSYDVSQSYIGNIDAVSVDPDGRKIIKITNASIKYLKVNGYKGGDVALIKTTPYTFMMVEGTEFPDHYIEHTDVPYLKDDSIPRPLSNILFGKRLATAGDSLTEATNPAGGYFRSYGELVAYRNKMTFFNYGVSGSTLSNVVGKNPFCVDRYLAMDADLDYLTIWFGWNDNAYSTLGTIADVVDTTFYGAWNKVLPALIAKYPKAKMGLIVPYGATADMRQAVRLVGKKYGIPYLDLYADSVPMIWGRDNADASIVTARRNLFTYDGTHLNQDGHDYMSTFFEDFLRSL
jgi:lysophospholipase L1-like esterase